MGEQSLGLWRHSLNRFSSRKIKTQPEAVAERLVAVATASDAAADLVASLIRRKTAAFFLLFGRSAYRHDDTFTPL